MYVHWPDTLPKVMTWTRAQNWLAARICRGTRRQWDIWPYGPASARACTKLSSFSIQKAKWGTWATNSLSMQTVCTALILSQSEWISEACRCKPPPQWPPCGQYLASQVRAKWRYDARMRTVFDMQLSSVWHECISINKFTYFICYHVWPMLWKHGSFVWLGCWLVYRLASRWRYVPLTKY
jgi:hypothetical protein